MQINFKVWKGIQLYIFKEDDKVVGYLGIKMPLTAQQVIDSLQ